MDSNQLEKFENNPDCIAVLKALEPGTRTEEELAANCTKPMGIQTTLTILEDLGMVVRTAEGFRISWDALNCIGSLDDGTDEFLSVYEAWYGKGRGFMAEYLSAIAESLLTAFLSLGNEPQNDLHGFSMESLTRIGYVEDGELTASGRVLAASLVDILECVVDDRHGSNLMDSDLSVSRKSH